MNFPKKTGGHFLSKACWLLAFFSFSFFFQSISFKHIFLEKDCNPGKVGNRDYTLSKGIKGVRMKIHKIQVPKSFEGFCCEKTGKELSEKRKPS